MKKKTAPVNSISRARLLRAVASSNAIETGKPISLIEAQLKSGKSQFQHLKLAN